MRDTKQITSCCDYYRFVLQAIIDKARSWPQCTSFQRERCGDVARGVPCTVGSAISPCRRMLSGREGVGSGQPRNATPADQPLTTPSSSSSEGRKKFRHFRRQRPCPFSNDPV